MLKQKRLWRSAALLMVIIAALSGCNPKKNGLTSVTSPVTKGQPIEILGFFKSSAVESIRAPQGFNWSYVITSIIPEGSDVKPDDIVLTLQDPELEKLLAEREDHLHKEVYDTQERTASMAKEIDDLVNAGLELKKESQILKTQIYESSIENEWMIPAVEKKIIEIDAEEIKVKIAVNREKLQRQRLLVEAVKKRSEIVIDRAEADLIMARQYAEKLALTAKTRGIAIHQRSPWQRIKPNVGLSTYTGIEVLKIVDPRKLHVDAFLLEKDWLKIKPGMPVVVELMGRASVRLHGNIEKISQVVMNVGDWNKNLPVTHPLYYTPAFKLDITLNGDAPEIKPESEAKVLIHLGGKPHAA